MPTESARKYAKMVYGESMRTNIDIDERLVRKARKLTRLKSKRQIVDKALELLVRSESRKGILRAASGKAIPSPCGETEFDLGG
ncbi:MAG TPA: type II toxin-antitoxin system VapB family antitoxin [Candidatus Acidoferrum sp.]|jgi:Arc/MetJ family transcription regulator